MILAPESIQKSVCVNEGAIAIRVVRFHWEVACVSHSSPKILASLKQKSLHPSRHSTSPLTWAPCKLERKSHLLGQVHYCNVDCI